MTIEINTWAKEPHLHNVSDNVNAIGYTSTGWLNIYTLMCGYEEHYDDGIVTIRLYYDGCYHVRRFDPETGERIWESFDDVNSARSRMMELLKEIP